MRQRWIIVYLCFSLILTACAGMPAGQAVPNRSGSDTLPSTTMPRTSSPPTETSAPAPRPSQTAAPLPSGFAFIDSNPVLSGSHDWDSVYIDPGAIVYHSGTFHMFYNGIDGFPRPVGVGYATSSDGIHWEPQVAQPLFHASDLFPDRPRIQNLFVTSGMVMPDGTWVLYFYTLESSDFIHAQSIGRATAPNPKGPWKADPQMVLLPGPESAWDGLQVGSPKVLQPPAGYVMYYDGMNQHGTSMIGRATSPDGIHWTKYNDPATTEALYAESDPVLKPDPNSWDQKRVIDPNVQPTANGWQMMYLSTSCVKKFGSCEYALGQATSSDGIHWQKSPRNPVLTNKNRPDWLATYLVTMVQEGDQQLLYMDYSGKQFSGTRVYLAVLQGQVKP